MSAILLESGIVHYEVIGRGRPIIFLHGWVGSWRYWMSAMQTASTQFRAYAVDLWGFGDSAREPERYSLNRQVGLLQAFLNEMGIGKVALVAHGLGGLVGLTFTMQNQGVVDRIMAIQTPMELAAVNNRLRSTAQMTDLVEWLVLRDPAAEPARADATKTDLMALSMSFNSPNFNLANQVGSINRPCLLVYGPNDPAITQPPFDPQTAPHNIHLVTLEQSAHFPMLDDGARFNRLMTDFLALESGVSPRELQFKEEWRRRVR